MGKSINDEVFRLTVKHDKIQLEKAKARFDKSYNELLKEEIAKGKELDAVVRDLINRLSEKQKEEVWNDFMDSSSQRQHIKA